jgi:glycolate oxidase iron-sulfur subunit
MSTPTSTTPSTADPAARLAYTQSLDCVHCGLCTQYCPTFRVTGDESQNPRGRIYLMRAELEGRITKTPDFVEAMDSCLVCRACEAVCPSGVRFGELMAHTRAETRKPGPIRKILLRKVIPSRRLLGLFASLTLVWQQIFRPVFGRFLPAKLRVMDGMAPEIPESDARRPLEPFHPAVGDRLGTVAVLEGCVMPILFQSVNRDLVKLLTRAGFDVKVPEGQSCCGALHEHDGDLETAGTLVKTNARAFADRDIESIVMNSAGCGAALKGCGHLLPGDASADALARRTVDMSRFLVERGGRLRFRETRVRVTYDAPCHLLHAQGEAKAPLELVKKVPGITFVPMDLADLCCGAAGIYNVDHPDMSDAVLDPKLDALAQTGAEVLLTGNPGCMLQWKRGIERRGMKVRVLHPATFLADALAD